jgi:hypothetical protein
MGTAASKVVSFPQASEGSAEHSHIQRWVRAELFGKGYLPVPVLFLNYYSQLSRCTQFPEYVLEGHDAAPKSRNPPSVLYLNPGIELRQGNGIGSFWHSNPGRTLA